MSDSIHGHEVLRMMVEAARPLSRDDLEQAIGQRFGAQARFHTCAAQDLSAAQLIDFLQARGKFDDGGAGYQTRAECTCSHDEAEEIGSV